MTPEQHNKLLGILHLAYGGLFALIMIGMLVIFTVVMIESSNQMHGGPPEGFFIVMWVFIAFFYSLMVIPSFVAGYALLKRKKWARIASIIAGVVSGMSFPIGTAVCVYTLWFLFSEPGKVLYERPSHALPPPPPQFSPRMSPPDWR